eukprot:scaffold827_cov36-Phaeocystis_antarctica.AAC.4
MSRTQGSRSACDLFCHTCCQGAARPNATENAAMSRACRPSTIDQTENAMSRAELLADFVTTGRRVWQEYLRRGSRVKT